MKRFFLAAVGFLLLAPAGFAIVDANSNGLSDFWEKAHHHGELFAESFEPQLRATTLSHRNHR